MEGTIINSVDLLNTPIEPIAWLWDEVIAPLSVNCLTAEAGSYKTWVSLFLSRAIANGEHFMERETRKTKVIIFDKENSQYILHHRLRYTGASNDLDIYPKWIKPEMPTLVDADGNVNDLYMHFAEQRRLLIFDSLTRFHRFEENSASSMKIIFEAFQKMVNAGGTILLLHHMGKSLSDYRGSSEIKAGVDCLFTLRKVNSALGNFLVLQCVKHRYIEDGFTITMRISRVDGGIVLEQAEALLSEQRELEKQEKVALLIKVMHEHFSETQEYPNQSQIIQRLKGQMSKDAARATLEEYRGIFWDEERRGRNEKYYIPQ